MPTAFTLDQAAEAARYFHAEGYAHFKGVFTAAEMRDIHAATDRVKAFGRARGPDYRHANVVFWHQDDPVIGYNIVGMQWPGHLEPVLEAVRRDPRFSRILDPLIGGQARQIINQLHWKTPGSSFVVNFHRDRENRQPPEAFRELARSYIQTGLPVDPMTPENGALLVVPGSHRDPHAKPLRRGGSNFGGAGLDFSQLADSGYGEADLLPVYADAGDVVLWHVDTIHGSGPNRSPTMDRCLYINGFVDAHHCMRGQWAFINGQGIPLPPIDVPVLVQRDDIFDHLAPEHGAHVGKSRD